jgi:hypothetical protein
LVDFLRKRILCSLHRQENEMQLGGGGIVTCWALMKCVRHSKVANKWPQFASGLANTIAPGFGEPWPHFCSLQVHALVHVLKWGLLIERKGPTTAGSGQYPSSCLISNTTFRKPHSVLSPPSREPKRKSSADFDPEGGDGAFIRNVGSHVDYTALSQKMAIFFPYCCYVLCIHVKHQWMRTLAVCCCNEFGIAAFYFNRNWTLCLRCPKITLLCPSEMKGQLVL